MQWFSRVRKFRSVVVSIVWTVCATGSAFAQDVDKKAGSQYSLDAQRAGDLTIRDSGEIRVHLRDNLRDGQGNVYRVSLAFANRDEFEQAWPEVDRVDFEKLEAMMIRPATGDTHSLKRERGDESFQQILDKAESAICGDTILRAFTTLPSGISMGVNVHAAPSRIKPHKALLAKNTLPGSECDYDVFDDCDTFAIGGCGGPDCTWSCRWMGVTTTVDGKCIEDEVIGWNTCTCY